MTQVSYEILQGMLSEFQQELMEIDSVISSNLLRIRELDFFEDSFIQKEDRDVKYFSPREPESAYKSEISRCREIKEGLTKQNDELLVRKQKVQSVIDRIEKVLNEHDTKGTVILSIQEEERRRISRDLHDTSLQNLAHLVHKIELSSMYIDKDPLQAKLELSVVSKNLKEIIEEIRNTIFNLRPMTFDDLGMKATFERLLSMINADNSYELITEIEDVSCENNIVLVTVYRIVQECLTNIKKHAQASKIIFCAKMINHNYAITIQDNGIGFDTERISEEMSRHFGLSLMKEYVNILNGEIKISSVPGETIVQIQIPVSDIIKQM